MINVRNAVGKFYNYLAMVQDSHYQFSHILLHYKHIDRVK